MFRLECLKISKHIKDTVKHFKIFRMKHLVGIERIKTLPK